jgi:hypothetical protein
MIRFILAFLAFISLLASIGVIVLWVRSYRVFDYVGPVTSFGDEAVTVHDHFIQSGQGGMGFCLQVQTYHDKADFLARKSEKRERPAVRSDSRPTRYPGTKVGGESRNYAPEPPEHRWAAYGFATLHRLDYSHGNHTIQDYAKREMDRVEFWGQVTPDWFVLLLTSLPVDLWLIVAIVRRKR